MNKIKVVGIGPGALEHITTAAMKAVSDSDIVVGGKRNLEVFKQLNKKTYEFHSDMEALTSYIKEQSSEYKVCVVVSGDTGFYSLLDFLNKRIEKEQLEVIPGISSFQYLFSKLAMSWKNYALTSVHGRIVDYKTLFADNDGVFLLTDRINSPSHIAEVLINEHYADCRMIVGENLSYEDEKITIGIPREIIGKQFSELCVVVIDKNELGV